MPRLRVLPSRLRQAIDASEFFLEYQPILQLQTGEIAGVETLIRWEHPEHGRLEPADFIDVAEESGLVDPLTTYVLKRAFQEWTSGGVCANISINVSPKNLHDPQLADRVCGVLRTYEVPPSRLSVEITETQILSDLEAACANLNRLHDVGVRVVVDDFGRGYSSFSHLRELPIDELKIDRAFIALETREDEVIVRSMIELAHDLGLTAVAEGVETESVRSRLQSLGCDAAQGFLFSRAMRATQARAWMLDHRSVRTTPFMRPAEAAGY